MNTRVNLSEDEDKISKGFSFWNETSLKVEPSQKKPNEMDSSAPVKPSFNTIRTPNKEAWEVEKAIESLHADEKAAFLEAKRRAPLLVEKESNPLLFLICENRDAMAAARRLAAYWSKRKHIFGEKAFQPMNQTGEGALNRADMALLSGGFLVLLPENDQGHSIVCYDGSRLTKAARDCDVRVAFYCFSLATENAKSKSGGVVLLHLIDKLVATNRDKRRSLESVMSVFPFRLKEVHAIANESLRASEQDTIFAVEKVFGKDASEKAIPYTGMDKITTLRRLELCGLSRGVVPKSIGGSWGYENFVQWQELRTRLEWDLPAGVGTSNAALKSFDFSGVKSVSELTEEERVERKRRMNVLHSRRKRERERIEIEVLQEQCSDFQDKNGALLKENSHLEDLIKEAKAKVARYEEDKSVSSLSSRAHHSPDQLLSSAPLAMPFQQSSQGLISLPQNPMGSSSGFSPFQQVIAPVSSDLSAYRDVIKSSAPQLPARPPLANASVLHRSIPDISPDVGLLGNGFHLQALAQGDSLRQTLLLQNILQSQREQEQSLQHSFGLQRAALGGQQFELLLRGQSALGYPQVVPDILPQTSLAPARLNLLEGQQSTYESQYPLPQGATSYFR